MKKSKRRLSLNPQTITVLTDSPLARVGGGNADGDASAYQCPTLVSCYPAVSCVNRNC
jgi:hypothetical protein